MNNDNQYNKNNPLEELRRINERVNAKPAGARPQGSPAVSTPEVKAKKPIPVQRPAVQPQRPVPARPAPARPVSAQPARPVVRGAAGQTPPTPRPVPAAPVRRGAQSPTDDIPITHSADGVSRAEKVRLARQNSLAENARRAVQPVADPADGHTRVSGVIPPQAKAGAAVSSAPSSGSSRALMKKKDSKEKSKYGEEFEETVGRGIITNTVKAVIYIVCVLVVSGCLSLFAIFVGNDAFAFVKDDEQITVTIPEGATLGDIAGILGDNDIVNYPSMFKLYVNLRKKGADSYLSGDFVVSPSMPYDTLISTFKASSASRKEITLTIIEGMNVDEIIDLFVENKIGTREKFVDVIQNYDYDFWFVDELDSAIAKNPNSGRKYRLEGYLFPDTYNFYTDASEEDVIYKLLVNFNAKFDDDKRTRANELGYSVDEIVNLASIIQKEAKYVSDYSIVSGVFHNRLNTNVTGKKLESNATVQYTMPKEDVKLALTRDEINKYDNAYNTYLYPGLPAGAISNPSLNAINWALYPAETDYNYFVSDAEGYNLYAKTYPEHERNVAKVAAEAAAAGTQS